ncbi:MAG TPA: 2'-5' RNA ligase family protein, partial [Streptomyces sp.]|nr:2'-5' RNA ligase family protein [Streptomyces sp.]
MRLFAGLLPPGHVLDGPGQLADAVKELRSLEGAGRLRWADRANWHITLAFYGEVPDSLLPELQERLARAARRAHPMRLRVAGGGRFADRALWAGIKGAADVADDPTGGPGDGPADGPADGADGEAVRRLAAAAAAAGRRVGLETGEARRFHAHLTVARARTSSAPALDLRPYAAALDGFLGEPWTAGELALVRSN